MRDNIRKYVLFYKIRLKMFGFLKTFYNLRVIQCDKV